MNIDICATWVPGYEKSKNPAELRPCPREMLSLSDLKSDRIDGECKLAWREWRLEAGKTKYVYFPPLPSDKRNETDPAEHRTLRIRWYDPNSEGWEFEPKVFYRYADKTWYTNWYKGPERRR